VSISAGPFRLIGPGRFSTNGASTVKGFELEADDKPAWDLSFPATSDRLSPGIRDAPTPYKMDNTEEDCHVQIVPRPSKPLLACFRLVTVTVRKGTCKKIR
jgi:hypothetical protein